MLMSSIKPYQNEEESLAIGELTVENRLDRVSVYGSIDLTKDKAGLQQAKALKEFSIPWWLHWNGKRRCPIRCK